MDMKLNKYNWCGLRICIKKGARLVLIFYYAYIYVYIYIYIPVCVYSRVLLLVMISADM